MEKKAKNNIFFRSLWVVDKKDRREPLQLYNFIAKNKI